MEGQTAAPHGQVGDGYPGQNLATPRDREIGPSEQDFTEITAALDQKESELEHRRQFLATELDHCQAALDGVRAHRVAMHERLKMDQSRPVAA